MAGPFAWVDPGGILRVGPQSAGADPGPACYGQGGTQPTVTDANLVLGRLNPSYFLGGEIALDPTAAQRAIEQHCAQPLGMDLVEAAHGIVEIANTAMVNALRLVSVQRGYDPRDFALVAFGGAGPAHANRLAALTEIPVAIIPQSPGTASALGLLVTDLKHDYATTLIQRLDQVVPQALEQTFRELEAQGRETLGREGMAEAAMDFRRQAGSALRWQSHGADAAVGTGALGSAQLTQLLEQFHRTHDRAYGFSAPGEDIELVSVRLSAIGQIAKPALAPLAQATGEVTAKGQRPVYSPRARDTSIARCTTAMRWGLVRWYKGRPSSRRSIRPPSSILVPSAHRRFWADDADSDRSVLNHYANYPLKIPYQRYYPD